MDTPVSAEQSAVGQSSPDSTTLPQDSTTPQEKSDFKMIYVVVGLLVVLILAVGGYVVYDRYFSTDSEVGNEVEEEDTNGGEGEGEEADNCIDSDEQCEDQPDGTGCTYGVWCDEQGNVCGGDSCVGLGTGVCSNEECVLEEEASSGVQEVTFALEGYIDSENSEISRIFRMELPESVEYEIMSDGDRAYSANIQGDNVSMEITIPSHSAHPRYLRCLVVFRL